MLLSISSFENLEFLAAGKSGIVYKIDDERVVKQYMDSCDSDVERRAYRRLDSHPNIAKCLAITDDGSIVLERGQILRMVLQQLHATEIPFSTKFQWLKDAAEGLSHLHKRGIIQADVGCHNMVLTRDNRLKLVDFEGCSIDGHEATSCYEWFSYRGTNTPISKQTDIFAYGCAMYEIITGRPPYHELHMSRDRARLVEKKYQDNRFPEVANLPLSGLMQGCWDGTFDSLNEVVEALS